MNALLLFALTSLIFASIQGSPEDALLKMSQNSNCIKDVIDQFIKK
jgi:hypothetical protein